MRKYYKLIDAIDTPTRINVAKSENGVTRYGHTTLQPGKKYELGDDEVFIRSLKAAKVEKSHSAALIEALESNKIHYDVKTCPSCGGRVKKVSYHIVEVHDGA